MSFLTKLILFCSALFFALCVVDCLRPSLAPPQPVTKSSYLRILAIDGGGIKGILPAQILVSLESKIKAITKNPKAIIGDYFDVIAGTSTGGIMTLALMNNYTAQQVSDIWYSNADAIFGSSMKQFWGPAIDSAYNPAGLEQVLQQEIGTTTMKQFSSRSYAIVSFDVGNYTAGTFTRDFVADNGDFYAWQVGRATSAAPTYFPTAYIPSLGTGYYYTYVDGGMMANNPSGIALAVAEEDFPNVPFNSTILLSLGTGVADVTINGSHDWGYEPWYEDGDIADLMFVGPQIAVDSTVAMIFRKAGISKQYARIEYDQKATTNVLPACQQASFVMDNVKQSNLDLLVQCGQQIAQQNDQLLNLFAKYLTS